MLLLKSRLIIEKPSNGPLCGDVLLGVLSLTVFSFHLYFSFAGSIDEWADAMDAPVPLKTDDDDWSSGWETLVSAFLSSIQ